MGRRLSRVTLTHARFSLVPPAYLRRYEEKNAVDRDIEAHYCAAHYQVFGTDPLDSVGHNRHKLLELLTLTACDVHTFMLTSMHAHSLLSPNVPFQSSMLAQGKATERVRVYGKAAKEKYAAFSQHTLELLGATVNARDSAERRLQNSEFRAACWIIDYKLKGLGGNPTEPLLDAEEDNLDPMWLAAEDSYTQRLFDYSARRIGVKQVRHDAHEMRQRMQKHKHAAISVFMARERCMRRVIEEVTHYYGHNTEAFEIEDVPIENTLHLWWKLGLAIQHMECIRFVNYAEGIYAKSRST